MNVLEHTEPKKVFQFFYEIAQIPHGSENTKAISDYLADFARQRGLSVWQDEMNNVVIIKEATDGYEDREPLIIQGHMDMVCEKEPDSSHDFLKDPLDLYIDGDWLKARGTTLGGDDGIAVAYALALLDSDELAHPRLEVVITVDEEIGMLGASGIDLSMLTGHRMLNIDSEREGEFLTSCAGGRSIRAVLPIRRKALTGVKVTLSADGLLGGHSGDEINQERANADHLMARALREIAESLPFGLLTLSGGLKDNAIPRSCRAELLVPEPELETLAACVKRLQQTWSHEYQTTDPGVSLKLTVGEKETREVTDPSSTGRIIFLLRLLPNGVQHMSKEIPDLVETSLNLGIMNLTDTALELVISVRSSVATRKEDLTDKVMHLVMLMGGEAETEGDYPAWEYKADSPLREQITAVYKRLTGKEPEYTAIHAGLECGILSGKIKDLDCVSFGPDMKDIHTTSERMSISSVERVWKFLVEFLKQ